MTYRVVVTPQAERDLEEVFRFVALENPAAARNFVGGLRKRLKTLASMPKRCPRAPEDRLEDLEMRHLVHGRYRIIFGIDGKTVVVLQVRHGARMPLRERLNPGVRPAARPLVRSRRRPILPRPSRSPTAAEDCHRRRRPRRLRAPVGSA